MMKTVVLSEPLRGGKITSVTLRRPQVGELRGLKLTDIIQMDVAAHLKLLPRVTEPALLPDEVAALNPADFLSLTGEVVGFFVTAGQMAQLQADAPN